jgi:hypothetical protein
LHTKLLIKKQIRLNKKMALFGNLPYILMENRQRVSQIIDDIKSFILLQKMPIATCGCRSCLQQVGLYGINIAFK